MTTSLVLAALMAGSVSNPSPAPRSGPITVLRSDQHNPGKSVYRPPSPDREHRELGTTADAGPITRPITVRFAPFSGVERGKSTEYSGRFQASLQKYLGQQGITNTEGRAGWTITGEVLHVEGPDTPFLANVCLFRGSGRGSALVGCWSGRADSVFHFSDRLRNPALHRYGLAGEMGDRIRGALVGLEAQEQIRARLDALKPEGMRVRLESAESADNRDQANIRSGDVVSTRPDTHLRLQVDYPRARAVIALGMDRSGRWVPLFVPDQEEGAFADGTISFPIDTKAAFNGADSLTVWVIASDSDVFRKTKGAPQIKSPEEGRTSGAVEVISGAPRGTALWQENPMLRELVLGGANDFHAVKFTLRKSSTIDKPFEAPSRGPI